MSNGEKIITSDNKCVVPKREIHGVLCEAHSAIAHRGRDKTETHKNLLLWNFSRSNNMFVSLCKLHQQQKSVTNHTKKAITNPITNPITTRKFLEHAEIDLIDFRNLPCEQIIQELHLKTHTKRKLQKSTSLGNNKNTTRK